MTMAASDIDHFEEGTDETTLVPMERLSKQDIASLSEIRDSISLFAVIADWLMIILAIAFTQAYFNLLTYGLCVLFIGTRLHGLGVLLHEATHYRLCKNRKLNEWIGEVLLAWPLLITLYGYRRNHFKHHRHLNTEQDPDWVRKLDDPYFKHPKTMAVQVIDLVKALFLLRFFALVRDVKNSKEQNQIPAPLKRARIATYLGVVAVSVYFGVSGQLFMYWIVPLATSFSFLMLIRSVAEHHGGTMNYADFLGSGRHVNATRFETLLFPHNVNYHLDHHLYPSVPYYNLPKLHNKLLESPQYRARAHITEGYLTGLLHECTTPIAQKR